MMKTLLKKGTMNIDEKKRQECVSMWGKAVYQNPKGQAQVKIINANDLFQKKLNIK